MNFAPQTAAAILGTPLLTFGAVWFLWSAAVSFGVAGALPRDPDEISPRVKRLSDSDRTLIRHSALFDGFAGLLLGGALFLIAGLLLGLAL